STLFWLEKTVSVSFPAAPHFGATMHSIFRFRRNVNYEINGIRTSTRQVRRQPFFQGFRHFSRTFSAIL
ncbi:MAG: hypothetical protein ACOYEF_02065, partial [Planifilum sp.]